MEEVAKTLRFMQFYAHEAHNLCSGDTFFSDHDHLGGLYSAYEGEYDSVIERMVGLEIKVDIAKVNANPADVDNAIARMIVNINTIYNSLTIIRQQCESGVYFTRVSAADKTLLDTQKTNITTALNNVISVKSNVGLKSSSVIPFNLTEL
mgnify:CR=1 FL=1